MIMAFYFFTSEHIFFVRGNQHIHSSYTLLLVNGSHVNKAKILCIFMSENFPHGNFQNFEECFILHFLNYVLQFHIPQLAYLKWSHSKVIYLIAILTV